MIQNQLSRIESEIAGLNGEKDQHERDAQSNLGDNEARAGVELAAARHVKSKIDVLEGERQSLEAQKQQIEGEIQAIDAQISQNETEHRALVDRKLALTS